MKSRYGGDMKRGEQGVVQAEDHKTLPVPILRLAYEEYVRQYGKRQSFEQIQDRRGFGIGEVISLLADYVERLKEEQS